MVKRLLGPVLTTAVTVVLAVSLENDFLFFLVGFEIMLYIACFLQCLYLSAHVSMRASICRSRVLRGETFDIKALLVNDGRVPSSNVSARLALAPFPDEEELLMDGKLSLGAGERGYLTFRMDSSHCGALSIHADRLIVSDFLGIFERKCQVSRDDVYTVFVLPEAGENGVDIPETETAFADSSGEEGVRGSTEPDSSDIRAYERGDSRKLIHWKLSARLDELMVRELTDPAERCMWLYINLQESDAKNPVQGNPDSWDHFIRTVAAVSAGLLESGRSHVVMWTDIAVGSVRSCSVHDEESLQDMLCALLCAHTIDGGDYLRLPEEIYSDEAKETCIEINLQGDIARSDRA